MIASVPRTLPYCTRRVVFAASDWKEATISFGIGRHRRPSGFLRCDDVRVKKDIKIWRECVVKCEEALNG